MGTISKLDKRRLPSQLLREYDIRGTFGGDLTTDVAFAIGAGFATLVRRAGGECVACTRRSPSLQAAQFLLQGRADDRIEGVETGLPLQRRSQHGRLGYDAAHRYAKAWYRSHATASVNAYVPLTFAPGEAADF